MNTGRKIPVPIKNISCQDLLRYQDSVIYGYLRKRCQVNKILEGFTKSAQVIKWPNTFVVLRDGCLYIYKNESSPSPSKGSSLYGFSHVCECTEAEVSTGVPWAFKVVSQLDLKNNVLFFSAVTEADMKNWMCRMHEQILYANGGNSFDLSSLPSTAPPPPPSSRQQVAMAARGGGGPQQLEQQHQYRPSPSPVSLPPRQQQPRQQQQQQQQFASGRKMLPCASDVDPECDCEYTGGELCSDDDSDYEIIVDSDNETDDAKKRIQLKGGSAVETTAMWGQPFGDRKISAGSSTLSPGVSAPRTVNDNIGTKPNIAEKPKPCAPKPRTDQNNSASQREQPKAVKNTSATMCYYSVEKVTGDDMAAESTYMTNDEYPTFTGPMKSKQPAAEPLVNDAFWRGVAAEGESLLRTLAVDGTFMIRESSNEHCKETLLVLIGGELRRYRIGSTEEGKYFLDLTDKHFDTRTELIRHYRTSVLPRQSVKLTKPYSAYTNGVR